MSVRERLLSITESEAYPRMYTFEDQMTESPRTIRRQLDALVAEGLLRVHRRARGGTYWCLPERDS